MPGLLTVLPLAFVMVAGPQIISAVFLATSKDWKKNSAAFLAGVLITVTFFVSVSYLVVKLLRSSTSASEAESSDTITIVILLLLLVAAVYVFRGRKTAEPPKWMGRLQTATPRFSFRLGLLLLGVFPTDIVTSVTVGSYLAREGDPWYYCLPFVLMTLFLVALPVLLVLLLGQRAVEFLPKVRDWMNSHSWIVSELVIALFIGIQINTLVSS